MNLIAAPQRGVLASFALLIVSMMLSGQASAFDVDGFSYTVINATDVELGGCVSAPCAVKDIVIPATVEDSGTTYSVTTIGVQALRANALTSVIIPDSVTTIGQLAFESNALTSVIIGNSVETIEGSAFYNNALTSVTIGNSVTTIGADAFRRNDLTSVTIPDSVTTIGQLAFESNALTSVIIPDSVTTIGDYAFYDNDLTSVIIGNSVTSIGERAFYLNALTSVAFLGNFGTFNLNMFETNANLATITYAQGATGWDSPPRTFTPSTGPTGSVTATPPPAPVVLQIDIADPNAIKFIATGANSQVTNSEFELNDGIILIEVLTESPDGDEFKNMGGDFAIPTTSTAPYNMIYSVGVGSGSIGVYLPTGSNIDQKFSTSSPAFSGEGTVANLTNPFSYKVVCSKGEIVAGFVVNDSSPVIGAWQIISSEEGIDCTPVPPTIDSIAAGDGQATITFTPRGDNGSPITGYRYIKDDGSSTSSILGETGDKPNAIAVDAFGNVYTANYNSNNVSKITPDGTSSILGTTGVSPRGIAVDGAGNVYTANYSSNNVSKITPDGSSDIFGEIGSGPNGIAVDAAGNNIYVVNSFSNNVSKITPDGSSDTFGTTGSNPQGIALDVAGNAYTANANSNNISKITPDGTSSILGTTGVSPRGIAVDAAGNNIYVANRFSNNVSKVTPDGSSNIFGSPGSSPRGIALDAAGNLYTANYSSNNVSKITPDGISAILGATGSSPFGIALDAAGNIYTANEGSNNVSKITPASIVTYPATGDTSPITITGLTNGTEYLISLIAVNAEGESVASNSVSITPGTPVPPAIDSITSGNGQAIISFTPGVDNGSSITNYEYSLDGVNYTALDPADVTSPITITGLTNGAEYSITLRALNGNGEGAVSGSVSVTPAGLPTAPQITNTDYGNEEIYLTVSVANNGGSTISSYVATCTDGTTQYTGTSSTSRITVSGLTNGVGYSCSVTATNAAGTSSSSATSPPIVPEYIPVGLPIWLLYEASKPASP